MVGNDIVQYRAAIGIFYMSRCCYSKKITIHINLFHLLQILLENSVRLKRHCCNVVFLRVTHINFFIQIVYFLLLCSGDIESNPGPTINDNYVLDILHLNVRSIRNKLEDITSLFEDFDILCFTETHLNNVITTEDLKLLEYDTMYRKDRNEHGGGVMIYISNDVKSRRRYEFEPNNIECIWTEISSIQNNIFLCCIYRPPNADRSFWRELEWSLDQVRDITDNIIIVGDLNCDLLTISSNHACYNLMSQFNLENVIRDPTRITDHSQTLIDLILKSFEIATFDSGTLDIDKNISDHRATYISVVLKYEIKRAYQRKVWLYKQADFQKLNQLLLEYDWDSIITDAPSIDSACLNFTYTYIRCVRECVPEKTVIIRPKDKPWFDNVLRIHIRKRDRLRKKALKSHKMTDINNYKQQRNRVNNMKKQAKCSYYDNIETQLLDSNKNDVKLYWKLMKDLFKSKSSSSIPPLKTADENGTLSVVFSDKEKVEVLNKYFASISRMNETQTHLLPTVNIGNIPLLSNITITEEEVKDIIKIIPINKAVGPDSISHKMLKETINSVALPLSKLYNKSLIENCFPKVWKFANVLPLFKKDYPSLASNYRPVSLLSCVGKIMERIVFKNVYNHFHRNNLFYQYQAGFLPGHSTVYQLIEVYHNIVSSLDAGKSMCMVFCDLSKAFDRVWHQGLIYKLNSYGVVGKLKEWFQDYLSDRLQRVMYRDCLSSYISTNAGVPQGSVLGPLLFLIYVNDISNRMLGFTRLFADDTSLQFSSSNVREIECIMNHDLEVLNDWSTKWKMEFNPAKTKVMYFNLRDRNDNPHLYFQNCELEHVASHKHLGLYFSNDAKWSTHINTILAKAHLKLNLLRKLKYKVNRSTLSRMYITFIRPLLEYASNVWHGCSSADTDRIEKLQLEAARIVTGLTVLASKESLYFETGWEPLSTRRQNCQLLTVFKIHNNLAPNYLIDIFPNQRIDISRYETRNALQYNKPKCRLEIMKKSFVPSSVNLWNTLSDETRLCNSIITFKTKLKTDVNSVPLYFKYGKRWLNVIHSRIRHNCSGLKGDLFRVNICDNPCCDCGILEDAHHYFFCVYEIRDSKKKDVFKFAKYL